MTSHQQNHGKVRALEIKLKAFAPVNTDLPDVDRVALKKWQSDKIELLLKEHELLKTRGENHPRVVDPEGPSLPYQLIVNPLLTVIVVLAAELIATSQKHRRSVRFMTCTIATWSGANTSERASRAVRPSCLSCINGSRATEQGGNP